MQESKENIEIIDVKTQPHYNNFKIQPVVFIVENKLGYLEGNAIKYLCRHSMKNKAEDVRKAIHYCEILLRQYETGEVKP